MKLANARVILTGASGGIGRLLALELADRGARLVLVGRRKVPLLDLEAELRGLDAEAVILCADLSQPEECQSLVRGAEAALGGIDLLINNAGMTSFTKFADQPADELERIVRTNILGPMMLTRAALPGMIHRGGGRIVNIGSMFGTIAFPCFAAYSASKFALRGFSQALRRELRSAGIGITYVAPRSVHTAFNTAAVHRMAENVKMKMDDPLRVARRIIRAIENDRKEVYLGFPERIFARINALWPALVDFGLKKQTRIIQEVAGRSAS